jgi:hypothetical protein
MRALGPSLLIALAVACGSFGTDEGNGVEPGIDGGASTSSSSSTGAPSSDGGGNLEDAGDAGEVDPCPGFCASFDEPGADDTHDESESFNPEEVPGNSPPFGFELIGDSENPEAQSFSWTFNQPTPTSVFEARLKFRIVEVPTELSSSDAVLLKMKCSTGGSLDLKLKANRKLQVQGLGGAEDVTATQLPIETWIEATVTWDVELHQVFVRSSEFSPVLALVATQGCTAPLKISFGFVSWSEKPEDSYRVQFDDLRFNSTLK